MNYELLFDNIKRHGVFLNNEEVELVTSKLHYRKIKRKQLICSAGEVCQFYGFVLSGCLRSYSIDEYGAEHITYFAMEDWWISDIASFISQTPSHLNIETIEETELIYFTKESREQVLEEAPKLEKYFRILFEKSLVANHQRLLTTLSLPAAEKYLEFIKKYKKLSERIPQTHIASFLGISPEHLSKIRSELVRRRD